MLQTVAAKQRLLNPSEHLSEVVAHSLFSTFPTYDGLKDLDSQP